MHWVVPFAADLSEACRHVLQDLPLPHLERLLGRFTLAARDDGDAHSFSPPHERALAAARGWHGADGCLPFAAQAAAADGIEVGDDAWGLLTPAHWQLGRDHVQMLDPGALDLGESESRALHASARELLEGDGFRTTWGAPTRWYAARSDLAELATASLDRVVHRDVDPWLRPAAAAGNGARDAAFAGLRRLQSEVQLLFHTHEVNEAREACGALAVNSFWLSGCGRIQRARASAEPRVANALRRPLLEGDWVAWAEAWRALDAGIVVSLLDAPIDIRDTPTLTLCGERSWARFEHRPRSLWARARGALQRPSVAALLASL